MHLHRHARKLSQPYPQISTFRPYCTFILLTSILVLFHDFLDRALFRRLNVLVAHRLALCAHAVRGIHPNLQLITLPAKDIISVLPEASVVSVAEVKWLRAVGRPQALVVEGRCIPHNFVH
jgi:hypothetical protein